MNKQKQLHRMLRPNTAAVIGASSNPASPGGRALSYLLDHFDGKTFAVNSRRSSVQGVECLSDPSRLPATVDLLVVSVPADSVVGAIEACGHIDVGGVVVLSAGFREGGPEGAARQAALLDATDRLGARLLGPNCSGFANLADGVFATMSSTLRPMPRRGPLALVSQSGGLGATMFTLAQGCGLGLEYFLTTGNEADISSSELALYCVEDESVKVVAVFSETVRDGPMLLRAANRAAELGKKIVYLKAGRTAAGGRAAFSHTASMTGASDVSDAVFDQYGILRPESIAEMLDMTKLLLTDRRPNGNRVGILTQTGGGGVLLADALTSGGYDVPVFTREEQERLAAVVEDFGSVENPVDVTGQMSSDPGLFRVALEALCESSSIDIVAPVLGPNEAIADNLAKAIIAAQRMSEKPIVVTWLGGLRTDALNASGVSSYPDPHQTALALQAYRNEQSDSVEGTKETRPSGSSNGRRASAASRTSELVLEHEAKLALKEFGLPVVEEEIAHSVDEAVSAADRLGYPVALKVLSSELPHRAEVGCVALSLTLAEEVRRAYLDLVERGIEESGGVPIDGILVQPMVDASMELSIGMARDESFGAIVSIGLGGTLIEVIGERVLLRAPFTPEVAARKMAKLCNGRLLSDRNGLSLQEVEAVASAASALGRFAAAHEGVVEIDCNPVLVGQGQVTVVDALIVKEKGNGFAR